MCAKGANNNGRSIYINYKNFKEKYYYFNYNDDNFYCNILIPSNKSLSNMQNDILINYLKEKERHLKYLKTFRYSYLNELDFKNHIIQLGILIVETSEQNTILSDLKMLNFFRVLLDETKKSIGNEKFYKVMEENFTKNEIQTIIGLTTYNPEFEYYEVEEISGFPKVEEANNELKKKEALTSEEWRIQEGESNNKIFEKEVTDIWERIYLLSDNKIIIVNEKKEVLKEIKLKNYKKAEFLVYKDILYVYSDKKIYEIQLNDLEKVKIIEL